MGISHGRDDLAPGVELGADGLAHGRDPRRMARAELRAMGHRPMSPTQAIRARCLDCCAGSPDEVRKCVALRCPSWPFRMGVSPWRPPRTEAQLAAAKRAMQARRRRALSAEAAGAATPVPAGASPRCRAGE